MNGASKILTVSYGTFSCTLEGFDDPFNTMKAIAEYFRDLAAEDRYFGAEPPTPDAAMLHRIAEREIQRRVEAKIQENGVVLRASESEVAPAPLAAPVAAEAPAPSVAPQVAPVAAPVVAAAPAPSVAPADASTTESVVAKLSRLRSEVAAQPGAASPVATMPTVSFAIPDYLEDEHADVIETAPLPAELVADLQPEEAPVAADAVAAVVEDVLPEDALDVAPEEVRADTEKAVLAALAEAPQAEGPVDTDLAGPADIAETAPDEEAAAPEAPELPESLMAALADSLSGGDELDALQPSDPVEDDGLDLSAASLAEDSLAGLADLDAQAQPVDEAAEVATFEALVAEDPAASLDVAEAPLAAMEEAADAQDEALEAAFAESEDAAAFDTAASEAAQDEAVAAALSHDAVPEPVEADDAQTGPELRPGAAEKLQRARARVIRIRRGDEAGAEDTPAPDVNAEPETPDAEAEAAPAPISPVRPRRLTPSASQPNPAAEVATSDEAPAAAVAEPVAETVVETAAETVAETVAETEVTPEDAFEANLSSIFAEVVEEEDHPAAAKPVIASPTAVEAIEEAEEAVESLLSADDEAELMRELAALRNNEEDSPDGAAAGASAFVLQQESRKGFSGPTADEALGRLMKQTDSEMEGPETKRRQSAIAHLKAAVAATVAERKVTGDKPADTSGVSRLARYRNDLAMVVKSALPGRGNSEEPKDRPAPLVLVSEQRIDKPRPAPQAAPAAPAAMQPIQPVRPRRVSSNGLAMQTAEAFDDEDAEEEVGNVFGDTKGFVEFVDQVGAVTLEEILEASAAYLAGVEGMDSFSRPQMMHHVGAVLPPGTFQREDGLRGFGALLRNGRITKLRRGQFALSEESPYLAEAKKIAG